MTKYIKEKKWLPKPIRRNPKYKEMGVASTKVSKKACKAILASMAVITILESYHKKGVKFEGQKRKEIEQCGHRNDTGMFNR